MNAKKVVGFLLLRPVFNQRNISSLLLVGIFFGVYVLAGGKVTTTPPKVMQAGTFGGAKAQVNEGDSQKILGIVPSEERYGREAANIKAGLRVDPDIQDDLEDHPLDKSGLIAGEVKRSRSEEWRLRRGEKKKTDSLLVIEERLGIKRK